MRTATMPGAHDQHKENQDTEQQQAYLRIQIVLVLLSNEKKDFDWRFLKVSTHGIEL